MSRQIAFDTETTGLDPASGHRVVEIGCVEMVDYIRTGEVFHVYINPERDMPPEAERVHGLSAEFLADKPLFDEIAKAFVSFVGDAPLVAHNAGFDMKFINAELLACGYQAYQPKQSIDTLQIARRKYPGQPASLDALCRRFEIDLSARTKHGALLDAELLADVYLELMGGRQSSFGLSEQRSNKQAVRTEQTQQTTTAFPRRHFQPAEEELESHRAFVEANVKGHRWQA